MIVLESFAKINLGLEIIGKREDGYHNLKTIFQSVDLFDTIEIAANRSGKIDLAGDDRTIPWDEKNIIARAFAAFYKNSGVGGGFDVFVKKRIPAGSGLGGGSSNAAVILLFLNEYFKTGISTAGLIEVAAGIGADVPYFLVGGTALGEGIGEKITPLADLQPKTVGVVIPDVQTATSLIFSKLSLTRRAFTSKIDTFMKSGNFSILENDLEKITFLLFPEVRFIKEQMKKSMNSEVVLMSGSGSAVYCLAGEEELTGLKNLFPGYTTFTVHTVDRQNYFTRIGASPSGKAPVFGAGIRRFESFRPSIKIK